MDVIIEQYFDLDIISDNFSVVLDGFWQTVLLSIIAGALSLILGPYARFARRSPMGGPNIWVLRNRLAMNAREADARNLRACGDDNVPCRRRLSFANYQHRAMSMANHRIGDTAH